MKRNDIRRWLGANGPGLAVDLVVDIGGPWLIYSLAQPHWGDVGALLAASVPPVLWALGGFLWRRRLDAMSLFVITGIALSLLAFIGGGSARMLQLRENLVTLLIGLVFLGSAAIGRPVILPLARAALARRGSGELEQFDSRSGDPVLRRRMTVITLVWGGVLVVQFALSVALILLLPIADYLVVGPVVSYATIGVMLLWTLLYRRRAARGLE